MMKDDVSAQGTRQWLYPEIAIGGYSRRDGTVAFYTRIAALTDADSRVLDFGCGLGAHLRALPPAVQHVQRLQGRVHEVIGTDVDPACSGNPYIDRFVPISVNTVALEAESVDVCVSDWVLEHLRDVDAYFGECERLIRPGGFLCIRTPNRYHYSSAGARLVPFRHHQAIRRWLGQFHDEGDVFPTYYRCNTRSALMRQLRRHRFDPVVYRHRGDSHLAGAGRVAGVLGELFERLSPGWFGHELHAFGRKVYE